MHPDFRFIVNPEDVESLNFNWGKVRITLSPEVNGASRFSAGIVSIQQHSGHERHNHPGAEEIIHIYRARASRSLKTRAANRS